jgi:chorismate lyase
MPVKSLILASPPRWHSQQGGMSSSSAKTHEIRSWLLEAGSLTLRLRNRYGDQFGVVLLQQRIGTPYIEECMALGLRPGARAIIREVGLMAGRSPVVLARSIIPQDTMKYADPRLSRLGNQPLGEILFTHPELGRTTLEWTKVPLRSLWNVKEVMGRRSLYTLGQSFPLLVAEFFLPELLDSES